jgi:IS30 family transposase
MGRPFTSLTLDERRVIARMLQAKGPKTKIAQMLDHHPRSQTHLVA